MAPIEESNHGELPVQHHCMSTSVNRYTGSESMGSATDKNDKVSKHFSPTQTTSQKCGFIQDEGLSREVIPFASSQDGTYNISNSRSDFKCGYNSGSAGSYCEADKPHKLQDHQLTLPHPIDISNDSAVKELVTG